MGVYNGMRSQRSVRVGAFALALPLVLGVSACGKDVEQTTGTNSLTIELSQLVNATGSELTAELRKNVDYGKTAPTWSFPAAAVTASPFTYRGTVDNLPEGEFDLTVQSGLAGTSQKAQVKGQACEMSLRLGKDEKATIAITGLNEFGDKGYGECRATVTR